MRSKKSKDVRNNLNLAIFFLGAIFLLILFSLLVKIFIVLGDSKFNANSPFNILVQGKDNASLVTISSKDKKLSAIVLNGNVNRKDAQNLLGIKVDSQIESNSFEVSNGIKTEIGGLFQDYKTLQSDLSFFDRLKIIFYIKFFPKEEVTERTLSLSASQSEIDAIISDLVSDKNIIEEAKSIEVINASGIDGIGAKAARIISNMGGNVVLISTSKDPSASSVVEYREERGYTAQKLSSVFGFEIKKSERASIADVIMVVGKNRGGIL